MKPRLICAVFIALLVAQPPHALAADRSRPVWRWSFEYDSIGKPPPRFQFARTGGGQTGLWLVLMEQGSMTQRRVLAQVDPEVAEHRLAIAVADEPILGDVQVRVRCKLVAGTTSQSCGVVARYQDPSTYYVAEADALLGTIRLDAIVAGERRPLAAKRMLVPTGVWHGLRLDAAGDQLDVYWNSGKVLEARDATLAQPGRAGVWIQSDARTYFDELTIQGLDRPARERRRSDGQR